MSKKLREYQDKLKYKNSTYGHIIIKLYKKIKNPEAGRKKKHITTKGAKTRIVCVLTTII